MKNKPLLAIMFISGALLITTPSYSHTNEERENQPEMSTEDIFFKKVHVLFENLESMKLTDEQSAKIKKLKLDTKKAIILKDAEIEVKKLDIKSAMFEDMVDLGAINTLIDQKYELKKQKDKAATSALIELNSILTKQQQGMLKSFFLGEYHKHYSKGSTK